MINSCIGISSKTFLIALLIVLEATIFSSAQNFKINKDCDKVTKILKSNKKLPQKQQIFKKNTINCFDTLKYQNVDQFNDCVNRAAKGKTPPTPEFQECYFRLQEESELKFFFGPKTLSCYKNLKNSKNKKLKRFTKKCAKPDQLEISEQEKCLAKAPNKIKSQIMSCIFKMTEPDDSWPALIPDDDRDLDGTIHYFDESTYSEDFKFYHVYPKNSSDKSYTNRIIIVNYDWYGFEGSRSLSLCDQLSRDLNAHVIMPDYFRNDSSENHGSDDDFLPKIEFLLQFTPEVIAQDFEFVIDWLVDNGFVQTHTQGQGVEDLKISSVGFCWGGWATMKLADIAASPKYNLKCAATCHPSPTQSVYFGQSQTDLFNRISSPQYVAAGYNDVDTVLPGGQLQNLLSDKGIHNKFEYFPEMSHGWVLRGDVDGDDAVRRDVMGAIEGLTGFLDQCL